jgi:hypothetical protein
MAEVIKTILTADSSELAAEFAKASAVAQKYANDRAAQGGRALATARAEIEALRLEADGFGNLAASMRASNSLREQAVRLAQQAGITEEKANAILREKQLLQQNIAIAAERHAAAEVAAAQRSARLNAPGRNGVSLPELALTTANLQAMEKGAARANELQRKMEGLRGGGSGAAMGLLAVSQAAEDAQYGIRGVINNIPQAIMAFGGFSAASMFLAGGISIAAVAAVALYDPMRKLLGFMDKEMNKATLKNWSESVKSTAKAIAQLRQESVLGQNMLRFSDALNENLRQRLQLENVLSGYLIDQGAAQSRQLDYSDRIYEAQRALAEANGKFMAAPSLQQKPQALESELENRKKILEAASAAEASLAERVANVSAESSEKSIAASQKLLLLRENLVTVTKNLEAGQKDLDAAQKNKSGFLDTTVRAGATLISMNPISGIAGGGVYSRKKEEEIEAATLKNLQGNLDAREKVKVKIEQQIAALNKQREIESTSSSEAIAAAKAKLDANHKLMQSTADQIRLLEERYPIEKQLADLEEQRIKALAARAAHDFQTELSIQNALAANDQERVKSLQEQRDIEAEKASIMANQRSLSDAQVKAMAKQMVQARAAAAAANQEAQRNQSRTDVFGDLEAMRMEAAGDKKGADELREDLRIREEAVALAERLGISENQATLVLRERARLQKEIDKRDADPQFPELRRRGIRRLENGANDMNAGNNLNTWKWNMAPGLKSNEIERRNAARANRPLKPSDDSAKVLLKSVNIQEEMLKIWQKINVV